MTKRLMTLVFVLVAGISGIPAQPSTPMRSDAPKLADSRLEVSLFATAPDIVHPIGMDFDSKGRLLVIESHTHFRPTNYTGPKHDRIRMLEDTDGDGKADRFTTFFEGTRATMDIAVHPDGSVYLATRNEIIRLRDSTGTGKADERKRIVFLDTSGDYPHNGLSGLSFDSQGNLFFGMGENLGGTYKVIGSDGTTIRGEGDGGHIFWCTADGRNLRRVATGFWNPFGTCRDIFGRLFAVDNDPDEMPPCRLVHVVPGGDYGFQFRYGRTGRHPFQSWDGQLPGTLPMASGTGEAPCEVLSYESDGLPAEYRGNLLVASWADHRVERYELKERGASVVAGRKPFLQGGSEFRPVGLAVAADGSLFVSDWVRRDYALHGKGAIWHVRSKDRKKPDRPDNSEKALLSAHRPLREAAARKLATTESGRAVLRQRMDSTDVRVRAACLTALVDAQNAKLDLKAIAEKDAQTLLRAMAVQAMVARGEDASRYLSSDGTAALRREAIGSLRATADAPKLLDLLADPDPFIRSAAVHHLAQFPELLAAVDTVRKSTPQQRIGLLLASRASGRPEAMSHLRKFVDDPDEDVRFLAAKWISDEKLMDFRPKMIEALKSPRLNIRMYFAYATALARLDGKEVSEAKMADYFVTGLTDQNIAPTVRARTLSLVPAKHPRLTLDLLAKLLKEESGELRHEAVRALAEHPDGKRTPLLREVAQNPKLDPNIRAMALIGLADRATDLQKELVELAINGQFELRAEALRNLIGVNLTNDQRTALAAAAKKEPAAATLTARVFGKPFAENRPPPTDLDAWLNRLEGPASIAAGQRIFFHSKLAGCFRCHRAEGRGRDVGPDLSSVGRNNRRHILESILQPSNLVAPHYQVWNIETTAGKALTGMLVKTDLDLYTYLDAKGEFFKLRTTDIAESRTVPQSIMPDGLVNLLTDQELRDLMAYLSSLR